MLWRTSRVLPPMPSLWLHAAFLAFATIIALPVHVALAQFTQQGPKLVGTGALDAPQCLQGASVALSADGNTAIVGGIGDNFNTGAAWVYTRSGGVWTSRAAS
jgi:hypothetical protein